MAFISSKRMASLVFAAALVAAGCAGSDGATGPEGPQGPAGPQGSVGPTGAAGSNGTNGTDGMSALTGPLGLVLDGVASTTASGSTNATLTFTIYPAAAVCPGGVCPDVPALQQKTFYATEYAAASGTFPTAKSFSFNVLKFQRLVDGGKGAQYTATRTGASFAPEASASAFVYGYIGVNPVIPIKGHYQLLDDVASASKVYGAVPYVSNANVSGCEKCHVAPYSKHGYRQAHVAGLNDFVACKACHTDQRVGSDHDWQVLVDNALSYAQNGVTAADKTKYAYRATVMNDTHMSHAMEFAYPQTMANCVTCHEGKLGAILADKFFTIETCRSCHPVTGTGGTSTKRAPALAAILPVGPTAHVPANLYADAATPATACNTCHTSATGGYAPTFAQIHGGLNKAVYADATTRYADAFKVAISSASYDATAKELTFTVDATESPDLAGLAVTDIVPTLVISGYGYDSKDFIVSGHGSTSGSRNAEWSTNQTEGALNACDTNGDHVVDATDGPCPLYPRMAVTASAAGSWTIVAKLADAFGANIDAGRITRIEIGVLPTLKAAGRELAVTGVTRTFDLAGGLVADADSYGKKIVSAAKCNACHEALGTTFHEPNYGSAGVVGCRLCHVVGSGGGHLEMQSRSIDSYVHAIHSMQPFDIKDIDFTDPVAAMRYKHHIESTYPSFSTLNCVSCHEAGTFDVPDQTLSLPGVLSASATTATLDRAVGGISSYVVGPASRACGSCHRAELVNEDAAASLASFNAHTAVFGTQVLSATGVFDTVTQQLMAQLGGPAFAGTPVSGVQIESCSVCHATAGTDHQALFNTWKDGL